MPKARVLAVDDQRYFRELIDCLLTEEGYEVHTTSSGEEALHILEREDFDIVVTDLVMPGMDGTQLVERVKQRNAEQDIVMITGVVDVKTAVRAMKGGATDYILKPFEREDLLRSLDNVLQRRRLRHEHARLMAENLEYMGVLSLYERAAGLFSTLTLEPLSERLVEGLCVETGAQGGVLWVAEDLGESRLVLMGVRGLIRMAEESTELCVDQLDASLAPLLEEGRSLVRRRSDGDGSSEALYVPLRHAGKLLGIARLSDKLEGRPFSERDRAAAEKFVGLAATAVRNALRFRSLERRSFRDPTTKAYTSAYFRDVIRNEIQKANRSGSAFSLMRVDLGGLGAARREMAEGAFQRWVEHFAEQLGAAARSTDLLAVDSESRYSLFLPDTGALGAAVLKHRVRINLERSGVLDPGEYDERLDLALAVVTYPSEGTQVESLERTLDARILEDRDSLVRGLQLSERPFAGSLEALLARGESEEPGRIAQVARLLLGEVARRPRDQSLLVISPGESLEPLVAMTLSGLRDQHARTEVVVLSDSRDPRLESANVSWISPQRVGTARAFALYCGEGPAYAMVSAAAPDGDPAAFFHSADRSLVEHLAFQLQRDLGIPLQV